MADEIKFEKLKAAAEKAGSCASPVVAEKTAPTLPARWTWLYGEAVGASLANCRISRDVPPQQIKLLIEELGQAEARNQELMGLLEKYRAQHTIGHFANYPCDTCKQFDQLKER